MTHEINFNNFDNPKVMNFNGNITMKEMFKEYAESLGTSYDTLNIDYMFLMGGQNLKTDSLDLVSKTIKKKKETILVVGIEKEDPKVEGNPMDKINNNQFLLRNCQNINVDILDNLRDMAIFGCSTKKIIDYTLSSGTKSFLSADEAIQQKDKDPQTFILGVLGKYLTELGITTKIERTTSTNEKYKNLSNAVLQFIFNGLIFRQKFYLSFELSENRLKEVLRNKEFQKMIKEKIIKSISELYNILPNDITVTDPIIDKNYLLIVLFRNENIFITKEQLKMKFDYDQDLCHLKSVEKNHVIEGIILNKCILDAQGDHINQKWPHDEDRGGEAYLPPDGWDRYGLNVYNKYDNRNNDWLSYENIPGEWCIGYSWLNRNNNFNDLNNTYENDNDIKHEGQKVGRGIYCTQDPEIMDKYSQEIIINGEKYKLGLMLRVNPKKIRCPESNDDLWVVNGFTDEIRPYGILFKKLK